MIGLMFAMLMLSGFSVFGAAVLKKRFEETMPLAVMGIVAILFCFYICNQLSIGYYIILVLSILLYFASLLHVILNRNLRDALLHFFTPGFFVFIILLGVFVYLQRNLFVQWFDELRMWAALPKLMYYTNELQLGADSLMYSSMQSYPPGMALFQYFFVKSTGTFREGFLFIGYAIFTVSIILPITKKMKWKNFLLIPVVAAVIFILPITTFNNNYDWANYYYTLYMDPVIAILFSYLIYLLFKGIRSKLDYLYFAGVLIMLALLKDTGLLFVILGYIAFVINCFVNRRKLSIFLPQTDTKKHRCYWFRKILFISLPLLVSFIFLSCWKIVLHIYGVSALESSSQIGKGSPIQLLFHPTQFQKETIHSFTSALFNRTILKSSYFPFEFSYITLVVMLLVLTVIISLILGKTYRKKFILYSGVIFAVDFIYVFGLFLLYGISMGPALPCYYRYILVAVLIHFSFIVFVCIHCALHYHHETEFRQNLLKQFLCLLSVVLVWISPLFNYQAASFQEKPYKESFQHVEKIKSAVQKQRQDDQKTVSVFLSMSDDNWDSYALHHQIYFRLLENNIFIKNWWTETNIVKENQSDSVEDFAEQLIQGNYDYVYFTDKRNEILDYFSDMLPDNNYEINTLYKVEIKANNTIQLIP